ncbi:MULTISPECIES: TnsA endonuclease N-terminal domain-containing protein [unclassified Colwellia]|uniref:TnsA endonuclease N-terminal domain-containing protein n=1 Tax=unclassified Colwellia TaxID=196834 RepID=UPI0015F4B9CA|nr:MULTISPECIES: TnsA endonuclease N-terminal domain-containing protein [unclassified Colwellia]MBA6254724.1 TnsA endonuclease N-terminal domain-containing protein [Colwellia sp. MB3u-28]MBA6259234.1 TnsA endonuclease N-terminal domain-containing protein [Colwellia sp. MB3u-41]
MAYIYARTKDHLAKPLYRYSKINASLSYNTTKHNEALPCESHLEYDALHLRQFNQSIDFFETQPLSVEWRTDTNNRRKYTADIVERNSDGTFMVTEIKPEVKYNTPENRKKFDKIATAFADDGIEFQVQTEHDIYVGNNIDTYQTLHRYLFNTTRADYLKTVMTQSSNVMSLAHYDELLLDTKTPPHIVFNMLAQHQLSMNFEEPIRKDLLIYKGAL